MQDYLNYHNLPYPTNLYDLRTLCNYKVTLPPLSYIFPRALEIGKELCSMECISNHSGQYGL